jgi:hypothetical protein
MSALKRYGDLIFCTFTFITAKGGERNAEKSTMDLISLKPETRHPALQRIYELFSLKDSLIQ